jgi:hypothetical protein
LDIPVYISKKEVKRVCKELKIRDWTILEKTEVLLEEAKTILSELDVGNLRIELKDFQLGLEVELEHGIRFTEANVTNNHPILTAKIVIAHFKESLDYYQRLEVAEIEGDIMKAIKNGDSKKVFRLYKKLVAAKKELIEKESKMI